MDFRNKANLTRGMRNNNVGNLRPKDFSYTGQVGKDADKHAIFMDMKFGAAAMIQDLAFKFYVRSPRLDTINKFVHVYAPEDDGNDEPAYRKWISKNSGLGENELIPKDVNIFKKIVEAVGKMEVSANQYKMIPQADWDYAYQTILPKYFSRDAIDTAGATKRNKLFILVPLVITAVTFFF